jgi:hypothetical protein
MPGTELLVLFGPDVPGPVGELVVPELDEPDEELPVLDAPPEPPPAPPPPLPPPCASATVPESNTMASAETVLIMFVSFVLFLASCWRA